MGVLAWSKIPALRGMPGYDTAERGDRLGVADMAEISDGNDAVTGVVTASFGFDPGMMNVAISSVDVGRGECDGN